MDYNEMPHNQHSITRADVLSMPDYETIRKDKKQEAIARKALTRNRSVLH